VCACVCVYENRFRGIWQQPLALPHARVNKSLLNLSEKKSIIQQLFLAGEVGEVLKSKTY